MSFVRLASLLCALLHAGPSIACPPGYNSIPGGGCYKIINGTNMAWSDARDYCQNDSVVLANVTEPNSTTHLLALELPIERNALVYWLSAYQLYSEFWIDGMVARSTWNWSNQSITWYFEPNTRAVVGNGSYYKLVYNSNASRFQIADDVSTAKSYFICEYQLQCNSSSTCQPNGRCYMNMGQEICVCDPGYTGDNCTINIDECLAAPCRHGGQCTDAVNGYTCDCSRIFYTGQNCEIPTPDPTHTQRTAAFWAVLGVIIGLVMLLTLSDLPWKDILVSIGCEKFCVRWGKNNSPDGNLNEYDSQSSNSPTDNFYGGGVSGMKGGGLHVRNTVWTPDYGNNQTPRNTEYNGYRSPDNTDTQPTDTHRPHQKEPDERRIYAVDIDNSTPKGNDPADTMVSWTQQLQEQLRNKQPRETSASSTKQLIHSSRANDD